MTGHKYCVYNKASECFLSLGTARYAYPFAALVRLFQSKGLAADECLWITYSSRWVTAAIPWCHDLLYLDSTWRVIMLGQSSSRMCLSRSPSKAASLLVFPKGTIRSSHTECGHQLLVCPVAEMEQKLTKIFRDAHESEYPIASTNENLPDMIAELGTGRERNERTGRSLFVAWHWGRSGVTVDLIRNISETSLYLITNERWPLGATVNLNVQPLVPAAMQSARHISIKARVTRWEANGLSLEVVASSPQTGSPDPVVSGVN